MNMRTRKAVGCLGLLIYLGFYAIAATSLALALAPSLPTWAELVFYAFAGIAWVLPLKPLFTWMNRPDA